MQIALLPAECFVDSARGYGAVPAAHPTDVPTITHKQPRSRVLCISRDWMLGHTRHTILQSRFDSVLVSNLDELSRLESAAPFNVIVLCHSLSLEEREGCLAIARRAWPRAKVVLVASESGSDQQAVDQVIVGTEGPEVLLKAVQQVLQSTVSAVDRCGPAKATE